MSNCERHDDTLRRYVSGELSEDRLGELLAHCRECKECRQLLELHRDLSGLASRATDVETAEFDAMHARVLNRVAAPPARRTGPTSLPRLAAVAAAAVVLFAAGLYAGRLFVPGGATRGNGASMSRLVRAINTEAASNRVLADVEDSRFTYSNVSFRPVNGDEVLVAFDLTTHVELVEPVGSEAVRELLAHSLVHPSSTGARLKAMSYAARAMDPKVMQALIFAMRRDDSLAVRLKALTILSDRLEEPEVESAILATLRDDDAVQMRLVALDYLAAHRIDSERIREIIGEGDRPGDEALKVRLTDYENQI